MKLLVKNAAIATAASVFTGDVLAEDGKIVLIGESIVDRDARVVDAAGRYLLPGGVDAHTHFDLDTGAMRVTDNFYTGTVAAACGGVTTVIDHMGFGPRGCRLTHQADVYRELAADAVVDYGFHGVVQHVDDAVIGDMEELVERGISSVKMYLTYGFKLEDADILPVLERARELGVMTCVHCENDAIIAFLTRKLLAEGKVAAKFHPASRPAVSEVEAVDRMILLAAAAVDAPLYIVHLSTAGGLDLIRAARAEGRTVFAETCPQYLLLDESRYRDDEEGLKYIMAPPLRTPVDNEAMWSGLCCGSIDVVATDHCPFFFATQKQAGRNDFSRAPGGAPGVETRMSLLFSEGFMCGRLTLPEVVRVCCLNPARLFGLEGVKGDIRPGCDADFVLFDPGAERVIAKAQLHENVDYTPYEGMRVRGAPVMTVSRGEVIVENGVFLGEPGRGRFLRRGTFGWKAKHGWKNRS